MIIINKKTKLVPTVIVALGLTFLWEVCQGASPDPGPPQLADVINADACKAYTDKLSEYFSDKGDWQNGSWIDAFGMQISYFAKNCYQDPGKPMVCCYYESSLGGCGFLKWEIEKQRTMDIQQTILTNLQKAYQIEKEGGMIEDTVPYSFAFYGNGATCNPPANKIGCGIIARLFTSTSWYDLDNAHKFPQCLRNASTALKSLTTNL